MAGISRVIKSESDAFMGEYCAFTQSVRPASTTWVGEALRPVPAATTIRQPSGKVSTTVRPVAGQGTSRRVYLIEAKDLNDASRSVADPVGQDRSTRSCRSWFFNH